MASALDARAACTVVARGERLQVESWGCVAYARGLAIQEDALALRRQPRQIDRLILLEHPPVITCGRSSDAEHLLADTAALERDGIDVVPVGRGGDVTYHAPGQLIGYFVCDLRKRGEVDLHGHLRALEAGLIDAIGALGVTGERIAGRTGVFVAPQSGAGGPRRKIASIGIGVRHWITYHGFALNVSVDLAGFDRIVPCGLRDVQMTSLEAEGGADPGCPDLDEAARRAVTAAFLRGFA